MVWAAFDARGFEKPRGKGNFTIPTRVAVVMAWLSEKLARVMGKEPALTVKNLGDGVAQRWFDNSAAKRVFGYEPRVTLAEGVKEAADGYMGVRKEG